jgi:photosystem I reaction center subunit XII
MYGLKIKITPYKMGISTTQICIALLIAILPGFFALKLGKELYK